MQRVLFVRHMAIGDILLSSPIIDQFHSDNPHAEIDYYSLYPDLKFSSLIANHYDMKKVSLSELEGRYDDVFYLRYEDHPTLHIIDGYALSTGIKPGTRKMAPLPTAEPGLSQQGIRIALHPRSGHGLRNYPIPAFQEVIDAVRSDHDVEFVVLGDEPIDLQNCLNLTLKRSGLNKAIQTIADCDYFLGIDSGLLHAAQALGKPSVGIFGATLAELRVTNPHSTQVVRNESIDCLGCFHTGTGGNEIISECRRGDLACMNELTSDKVVEALRRLMASHLDKGLSSRVSIYEETASAYTDTLDIAGERARAAQNYLPVIEHWHNSSRSLSRKIWDRLRKGEIRQLVKGAMRRLAR